MPRIRIERDYYPNGQLSWEAGFIGDKLEGKNRSWHENGQLEWETFYENGLEHGVASQWDKDGKLLGQYNMDRGTGVEKKWYENGQLEREVSCVQGQFCGRFRCWFEDGEVISTSYYIRNKKVSRNKYMEACKTDPTLPRYGDEGSEAEEDEFVGTYQKRDMPVSDSEREQHNQFIQKFLTQPDRGEARLWLRGDEKRYIGEMTHEDSLEFVEEVYKAGAKKIIAVEIEDETTNCLIVELPKNGPKRESVFKWNSAFAQKSGFDPYDDWGQNEFFVYFS